MGKLGIKTYWTNWAYLDFAYWSYLAYWSNWSNWSNKKSETNLTVCLAGIYDYDYYFLMNFTLSVPLTFR